MIGTEGTRLLREKSVQGRPHRRQERRGGFPGTARRKASAWSGDQRSNCTIHTGTCFDEVGQTGGGKGTDF
ncbi:hypothetical protein [Peribacillus frigoritolerans]